MRNSPEWQAYSAPEFADSLPVLDANLVLRFFEKAEAALRAKSVDEPLFLDLIGRHAYWWNNVFLPESDGHVRQRLERLGCWTEKRAHLLDYWDSTSRGDFPASAPVDKGLQPPKVSSDKINLPTPPSVT